MHAQLASGLVVTALILIHASAQAEWIALEPRYQLHPLQIAYVDPCSMEREGHRVTLSTLIDWKAMQGGRSPTRFYSTKLSKQFDCKAKLVRTLVATDFYDHMGTAEVIGGGSHAGGGYWIPVVPETLNQGLWEAACGK